ncbi:unnamed protein product [Ambrosiozyma monospora]|uniref:Unnamed protein product n=1 Tax=Ambrosiozyma monospora TaxID=43982 RepID=A0ACB5SWN9_AMBMO|nr:unnamed protein product [Ambrosiozyma monospora]
MSSNNNGADLIKQDTKISVNTVTTNNSKPKRKGSLSSGMDKLIEKTDSFTNIFKLRGSKKRQRSPDSDSDSEISDGSIQARKHQKTKSTAEQEAFEAREKEYDEMLPEEYRKYRPKGFHN